MSEKSDYYDATEDRPPRDDLIFASTLFPDGGVAVDCGCGAGSDIAFLRSQGFSVQAFDIEQDAVDRCRRRFQGDSLVQITCAAFDTFEYPRCELLCADASLFFCLSSAFTGVWEEMTSHMKAGGVFCGSFLGSRDSMAGPDYDPTAFWPDVLTFDEPTLRSCLHSLQILRWTEHELDGVTAQGGPHHWHIFSVVAKKS